MSNIKLSPKHGVNPTIPVCFFCGKDKNEIALLGHIRQKDENGNTIKGSDVEAPMRMVLDYEPCDECKRNMELGITIIDVIETEKSMNNKMEISKGVVPTGSWNVIKEETFTRIFAPASDEMKNAVLKKRKMLMIHDEFTALFGDTKNDN